MRVPVSWLRSYCDPPLDAAAIGARLNDAGIELGRIERVGVGSPDGFVVGRVVSTDRHPNADRLSVCVVDDGSGEPRTIVCGAPNVAAGQTVAVARPGALMPGGDLLSEATLRGVRSSGMILAEDEVGVGPDHAGVIVFGDQLEPGTPLADVLPIQDEVLDLEVSPNRPDCLGVYGVAREVHALTGAPLADDPTSADAEPDDAAADAAVDIADPDVCLRFTARVFEDVRVGPSPPWLRARLSAAGQRPISNVVDITNYVMLVTGQPLHAFDLDELHGARIVVRRAAPGERLRALDGVERTLDEEVAVVADTGRALGIAGIMGGAQSEVSDATTRVLMEAATWVGPNILRTSAKLGLRTEASTRFEKQLHPDGALAAQRLAARLMVELCGARPAGGTLDAYPRALEPRTVELRDARVARLLGERIGHSEIDETLSRLGFGVDGSPVSIGERIADVGGSLLEQLADSGLPSADSLREHPLAQAVTRLAGDADARRTVTVPTFRDGDVQREADLVEEIARIHGVDRLPTSLPARRRAVGRLSESQRLRRRLEDLLRDRGLTECVAYSFTSPAKLSRLRLDGAIRLANPLSEDQSAMRPLLLPGLLDAAAHNAARRRPDVALFESARSYERTDEEPPAHGSPGGRTPARERHHVAAVLTQATPPTWRSQRLPADFFSAKALVEALLGACRIDAAVEPSAHPFLHPARQASVASLGFVGELHPAVASEWDLGAAACFELDFDAIAELASGPATYRPVSAYPPLIQDIAVVLPEDVPFAAVQSAARSASGLLVSVGLFDVYRGEQVGEARKSFALRLEFRAADRTLTDDDVARERAQIEQAIEAIGGRLRA